jgi:hypothetical protein
MPAPRMAMTTPPEPRGNPGLYRLLAWVADRGGRMDADILCSACP